MNCRPLSFAAALLLVTTGCDAGPATAPSGLPLVPMSIAGSTYHLEVAATDATRQHGLMERDKLPGDSGMIFVFPTEEDRGFWMYHTRFPLDIIYVRSDGTVVSVHTMRPYDEHTTPSGGPARYAIELAAGKAAAVKAGDRLVLPTLPAAPTTQG